MRLLLLSLDLGIRIHSYDLVSGVEGRNPAEECYFASSVQCYGAWCGGEFDILFDLHWGKADKQGGAMYLVPRVKAPHLIAIGGFMAG